MTRNHTVREMSVMLRAKQPSAGRVGLQKRHGNAHVFFLWLPMTTILFLITVVTAAQPRESPFKIVRNSKESSSKTEYWTGDFKGQEDGAARDQHESGMVHHMASWVETGRKTWLAAISSTKDGRQVIGKRPKDPRWKPFEAFASASRTSSKHDGCSKGQIVTHAANVRDQSRSYLPEGAIARLGKGLIYDIEFSPDGTLLAVSGPLGVWLYDAQTLEEHMLQIGPKAQVYAISFSSDGKMIAMGTVGLAEVWSIPCGQKIASVEAPGEVHNLSFSYDNTILAIGSLDRGGGNFLQFWYLREDSVENIQWNSRAATFSPAGDVVLTKIANTNMYVLLSATTREKIDSIQVEGSWQSAFSFDGKLLAFAHRGGATLYSVVNKKKLATFTVPLHNSMPRPIRTISFSPKADLLAVGGNGPNGRVWLFSVHGGKPIATFKEHTDGVRAVAFSADGELIASGGDDRTVRISSVSKRRGLGTLKGTTSFVSSVVFSPDGRWLANGSLHDGTVRVWSIPGFKEIESLKLSSHSTEVLTFSPDGERLAITGGEEDPFLSVWSVSQGCNNLYSTGHHAYSAAFSPDSNILASGGVGGVTLWDLRTGNHELMKGGIDRPARIVQLSFSRSADMIVSLDARSRVQLWSVSSREEIPLPRGLPDSANFVVFTPEDHIVAITIRDLGNEVEIVKVFFSSGQRKTYKILLGITLSERFLSLSPDGKMVATFPYFNLGSGEVEVFRVSDGKAVAKFKAGNWAECVFENGGCGHYESVNVLAFSPQGNIMATGSIDGTILIWDLLVH